MTDLGPHLPTLNLLWIPLGRAVQINESEGVGGPRDRLKLLIVRRLNTVITPHGLVGVLPRDDTHLKSSYDLKLTTANRGIV